jgi:hypothetical protein
MVPFGEPDVSFIFMIKEVSDDTTIPFGSPFDLPHEWIVLVHSSYTLVPNLHQPFHSVPYLALMG